MVSLVACDDEQERHRVRDSFLKTELRLTAPHAELDKAILDVCWEMCAERNKPRVISRYLVADKYGELRMFV